MKMFELQNMPPVKTRLYHSRKKLQRDIDRARFRFEPSPSRAQACVIEQGGETYCPVLFEYGDSSPQTLALLVHEAVHVAQAYWRELGEDEPSDEFMAYTVQQVAQYLMEEHMSWMERKGRP